MKRRNVIKNISVLSLLPFISNSVNASLPLRKNEEYSHVLFNRRVTVCSDIAEITLNKRSVYKCYSEILNSVSKSKIEVDSKLLSEKLIRQTQDYLCGIINTFELACTVTVYNNHESIYFAVNIQDNYYLVYEIIRKYDDLSVNIVSNVIEDNSLGKT